MVGPIDREERAAVALKLEVAFVLLVGLSAGTITLQGDASLRVTLAAVGIGLVLGTVLVRSVVPGTGGVRRNGDGKGR